MCLRGRQSVPSVDPSVVVWCVVCCVGEFRCTARLPQGVVGERKVYKLYTCARGV